MSAAADIAPTFSVTPEAIRARVDAAHRMMELAQSLQIAETVRAATGVALADMLAAGLDTRIALPEYRKTVAAEEYAAGAYQQSMDELTLQRVVVRLSA